VIISDTAGRTWREGQTDQAIGAAGVRVVRRYAGERDAYGNVLEVTATSYADELAAAADLAKGKLSGHPLAVVRGLGDLVGDPAGRAADLVRPAETDMFGFGSRESVLAAVLATTGQQAAYERMVALDETDRVDAVLDLLGADGPTGDLLRAMLEIDLAEIAASQPAEIDSPRLFARQSKEFPGGRQDQPVRAQG
jgi:coenzyme F420-0:L-glutamate ligase/coenzyme F420-1:gamma-L-glutamate ligase